MIDIQFVFRNNSLSPIKVTKDDLEAGYNTKILLDRKFNQFYYETITDELNEGKTVYSINLDLFTDFKDAQYSDIVVIVNAFNVFYNLQYNLTLPNRMGVFSSAQLTTGRNFFNSMSTNQRIGFITLVNIIGNERMGDLVAKLFAESLSGKSMEEIKHAIGW